jgi:DNA-binding NarL/FixJ family response regulator
LTLASDDVGIAPTMRTESSMRIYVISAYPTVRAGLRALAQAQPGWSVVGESSPDILAESGQNWPVREPDGMRGGDTGAAGDRDWPIVVDVALADLEGPAAAEAVRDLVTAVRPRLGLVVVGTGVGTPELREALAAANEQGAPGTLGFAALPREASGEEIIAAVLAAAGGLVALDRGLARALLEEALPAGAGAAARAAGVPGETGPGEPLTARELEVLQLVAEGLPNKLIAGRLHISEHTAKFHVASIMLKLGAASRTEAVTLAARRGLLIL